MPAHKCKAPLRHVFRISIACGTIVLFAGCEPAFNWRKTDFERQGLEVLLPCKPERATRVLPVGPQEIEFHMLGCATHGVTFAVTSMRISSISDVEAMIKKWRQASETQWGLHHALESQFRVRGADLVPAAIMVRGRGGPVDGSPLHVQTLYFSHGRQIFQATTLSQHEDAQAAEAFFSGLRLP